MSCYRFEEFIYTDGFLSDQVDATYIIHLEDNGRMNNITQQLETYHTTNTVYILFNKGYKHCEKAAYINNTARDIIDANIQIFKHAEEHGYGNILILEDDFIFSEKILEKDHQTNVLTFLDENKAKPFLYLLGCIPIVIVPYDSYNYIGLVTGGMHCVIFNKAMRDIVLAEDQEKLRDWDFIFMLDKTSYKYIYYTPLCYQLFPVTENSKRWGQEYSILLEIGSQISFYIFLFMNMANSPEPGFSLMYVFSKTLFLWFVLTCVYLFYYSICSNATGKNVEG